VLAAAKPGLLYDYSNFPPHTYQLTYPAPGAPELAAQVRGLLSDAGIESDEDRERDFDHGIFIPMKVAFPDADIPILQLSLRSDLDPAFHLAVGGALTALRDDNIAIIGSGLSFHNLRQLGNPAFRAPGEAFDDWLSETLCDGPVDRREAGLIDWALAPGARAAHPREEHLLPLMVAAGAAQGEPGYHVFSGTVWGKPVSAFHFG
jgi:aromatic ring-opening dioxygenase catalytic subunit (LigB family)